MKRDAKLSAVLENSLLQELVNARLFDCNSGLTVEAADNLEEMDQLKEDMEDELHRASIRTADLEGIDN